jgi:hypothetical protein
MVLLILVASILLGFMKSIVLEINLSENSSDDWLFII